MERKAMELLTGYEIQLLLSVISLISHSISFIRIVLGVSPVYSMYWTHLSVDGHHMSFYLVI